DGESEAAQGLLGAPAHLGLVDEGPGRRLGAEEEVLLDGEARDQAELLKDGADAPQAGVVNGAELDRSPPELDLSRVRPERARHDVDEGRFSGSVLAKQDVDLAGPEVEVHTAQRLHAGEPLRHPAQAEDGWGPGGR